MVAKNKVEIISKDSEGNEVKYFVTRPKSDDFKKAQIVANQAFKDAVTSGAMLRSRLEDFMIEQGLWNEEKQKLLEEIDKKLVENLKKLKAGGMKLSEARQVALEIRAGRMQRLLLETKRTELDEFTVESQAENARFDYLVSVCLKDEEGKPVFESLDDYKEKSTESYAAKAAAALASMLHGLDQNWEANLPENKFLKKYNFVNEELRLVDKSGNYVTSDNRLVDEDYNYVNEQGEKVDINGNKLDDDGLPIIESQPFLDDDGNPIIDPE